MEKDIKISGRKKDAKLVKKAAEEAAKEFEKEAGYAIKYAVDEELGEGSYVAFSLSLLLRRSQLTGCGIALEVSSSRDTDRGLPSTTPWMRG